jgi:hypothetical protein
MIPGCVSWVDHGRNAWAGDASPCLEITFYCFCWFFAGKIQPIHIAP